MAVYSKIITVRSFFDDMVVYPRIFGQQMNELEFWEKNLKQRLYTMDSLTRTTLQDMAFLD